MKIVYKGKTLILSDNEVYSLLQALIDPNIDHSNCNWTSTTIKRITKIIRFIKNGNTGISKKASY